MDTARRTVISAATGPSSARRADAGSVRLSERDVAGLLLARDMYGSAYDPLASFLGVRPDRLHGIVGRWRSAGYAATGRLGPGSAWCWLTRCALRRWFQGRRLPSGSTQRRTAPEPGFKPPLDCFRPNQCSYSSSQHRNGAGKYPDST